jgi:uncharacterized membrane protein (UPF0136 family)
MGNWIQKAPQYLGAQLVRSLVVFNGVLYGAASTGNLFAWNGVDSWANVAPPPVAGESLIAIAVFNNLLYGCTFTHGSALYQWDGGSGWILKAPVLNLESIQSMAVFNGKLYAGGFNSGVLYEWNGINAWVNKANTHVGEQQIDSLAVYNGELYGGTGAHGYLFKWDGVSSWVTVGASIDSYINALAVFNGKLYAGTSFHGYLYEWDGVNWTRVAGPLPPTESGILSLAVYNGEIYGGSYSHSILYKWDGVSAWMEVAPRFGAEVGILSLAVFNGSLFGGTEYRGNLLVYGPGVSTDPASVIGHQATLNGTLIDDAGVVCDCAFDWGPTLPYANSTPWLSGFITGDSFAAVLSGLSDGTYHFRAKAQNSNGTSYGGDLTFVVTTTVPSVDTLPAADITYTTATLNGDLTNDGGLPCQVQFEWGYNTSYGNTTPLVSAGIGPFSAPITGLTRYTIYHYRAVAVNALGTSYGADVEFNTLQAPPTVETDAASNLLMTSATLNGTLSDDGGDSAACQARFNYGTAVALGTTTPWQPVTIGQAFSASITSLLPGKIYYFRAESQNSVGSGNGSILSIQTAGLPNRAYSISRRKL